MIKSRQKRSPLNELLLPALVFVLALTIRLVFARGIVFDQSVAISSEAWQIISSGIPETARWLIGSPYSTKITAILTGISYLLLGVGDTSSSLPSLLGSLGLIALVLVLAKLWFSRSVGLIAAFLLAVFPLEVFLSANLLPTSLLTALKALSIYLLFLARARGSRLLYIVSGLILLVGLLSDWIIFLPAITLGLSMHYLETDNYFLWLRWLASFLIAALIFIPAMVVSALQVYDSALLLIENLVYLPLIFFALMNAGRDTKNAHLRLLLLWAALELFTLILASPWIVKSAAFQSLGIGAYWLQLLIPILILLGQTFVERVGERPAYKSVTWVSSFVLLFVLAYVLANRPGVERTFDVVTRISFGLSFLLMWLFAFLMNSKGWTKNITFAGFLLAFGIGCLMGAKTYSNSYAYLAQSPIEAIRYLKIQEPNANLLVAGEPLWERVLYLNDFQSENGLHIRLLDQTNEVATAAGDFVLIEEDFQEYVLGLRPENWQLITEFGQPDYQHLFLYQVE